MDATTPPESTRDTSDLNELQPGDNEEQSRSNFGEETEDEERRRQRVPLGQVFRERLTSSQLELAARSRYRSSETGCRMWPGLVTGVEEVVFGLNYDLTQDMTNELPCVKSTQFVGAIAGDYGLGQLDQYAFIPA